MENTINKERLFLASRIALILTAMTFAFRSSLEPIFHEQLSLSMENIGIAYGPAFYGFTIAMLIGGPLVDYFGMKKIMWIAFITHFIGIVLTLFATGLWSLFTGTLFIGIGNGMVEAACNPMVASMYTTEKTKMLNRFHVWFPGGILLGSLIAFVLIDTLHLPWQVLVALLFIPLVVYGYLFWGQEFPKTERVELGISHGNMWKAIGTPLFLFMAFLMLMTASTELGTTQRISSLLSASGVAPILVLAFINGIMAVGRSFAGPIVHRLSNTGMLLFSAVFSLIGLVWLSYASGGTTFLAAGVFAIGVCYFWPTMLGFVAEYIPESGALGLSLMGGLGMLAVSIVLPVLGKFMDMQTGGPELLRYIAILPAILIVAFLFLNIYIRKKKSAAA